MAFERLTKADIALSQLNLAISLYLEDRELVSAVTLAGAADEILGTLCEKAGVRSALNRNADSARALYKHLWKKDPGSKPFKILRSKTRNELKHLISGAPIEIDLAAEAGRLLAHAVENYCALFKSETPKMRDFQRKRLHAYRMRGV